MAREQRRLAAIVAADVVGYSRPMGRDESGTLARLREHRRHRLEPILARRGGRLVNLTGDGALSEFSSAVEAVSAAIEFQQAVAEANRGTPEATALIFRIGVHLGDLIVDGDDLYGDGVNVAARLEAEALVGGIVVSGDVHNAVAGKVKATLHDLGAIPLKNIEPSVQALHAEWIAEDWTVRTEVPSLASAATTSSQDVASALAVPDMPSVAALPFQNMSGDLEQECFADGMVEDVITALSRFKSLFVIARNSSFTYKGKAVDLKRLAASWAYGMYSKAACARQAARFASLGSSSMRRQAAICGQTVSMAIWQTSSISRTALPKASLRRSSQASSARKWRGRPQSPPKSLMRTITTSGRSSSSTPGQTPAARRL